MPEAAVNNNRPASDIRTASLKCTLYELSENLHACKTMLATIPKTNSSYKTAAISASMMLAYVMENIGQYAEDIRKLAARNLNGLL